VVSFEVYRDREGYFRWRLRDPHYHVIATGGQRFGSKPEALHSLYQLKSLAPDAEIEDQTG
jgi:uncharacterized protein YegP (UPF0339 family)